MSVHVAGRFGVAWITLMMLSRVSALTIPDWLWVVIAAAWTLVSILGRSAHPGVHFQPRS